MIKFVDMFSGIGGFREGLTRAGGFECVGHCEIDKYANRSYNALFDTKGEWFIEDARKADPDTMPDFQLLCGGSCIHKATTLMWKIHQQSNMAVCAAGRSPIAS